MAPLPRMSISELDALMLSYEGSATITDGAASSVHEIEVHTTPADNAKSPAWHVRVSGKMPRDLMTPYNKALSIVLPDGRTGVGTLVDPSIIRGAGDPPCC